MTPAMLTDDPMNAAADSDLGGVVDPILRDLFGPEADAVGMDGSESKANEIASPNPPDDDDRVPLDQLRGLMGALYGSDFPLINALEKIRAMDPQWDESGKMPPIEKLLPLTQDDDWVKWTRGRWNLHAAAVQPHLYLVARNRLFRAGQQWVSSRGGGEWRAPPRPAEQARVVHNMIAPALNQRQQIVTEQRPGFEVLPTSLSPNEKRKAEGRQQALEYQYDCQRMDRQTAEAAYWAQTDGVAFWHTEWDVNAGPLDARMGKTPGEGWVLEESKDEWVNQTTGETQPTEKKPLGDLRTKTVRVEQVRVSANATATEPPYYLIIRDSISKTEAAYLYGASGVQSSSLINDDDDDTGTSSLGTDGSMPSWVLTQTVVGEGNRLANIETVERFTIYVDKQTDILPYGLQLITVGNAAIWGPGELLFGVIPVTPVRDGSTDPSYYPRPIMEQWIDPQTRVNAALSLWVNSVRKNSGGSYFVRPDAISRETFTGTGSCLVEVEGPGPIGDQVLPVPGFLVGQDVKDLIAFDVKAFEDMSGYNDVSRGQVSGETATAVATANEQLQRTFAPPVHAIAEANENWGPIQLSGMAWGYDLPRDVQSVGTDRPDLARALSSADFEGVATIKVDGGKMMPMPSFYRKQILDDLFLNGHITNQQYMRNSMFGNLKNLNSPDEDQEARAKRIADSIRLGTPPEQVPPMRWQDDESIHQDVLQREILLQDDLDPQIIAIADQRWKALAGQALMKQGLLQPPPGAGGSSTEPGDQSAAQPEEQSLPTEPSGTPELSMQDPQMTAGGPPIVQAA